MWGFAEAHVVNVLVLGTVDETCSVSCRAGPAAPGLETNQVCWCCSGSTTRDLHKPVSPVLFAVVGHCVN